MKTNYENKETMIPYQQKKEIVIMLWEGLDSDQVFYNC